MSYTYIYSLQNDFTNGINPDQFINEVLINSLFTPSIIGIQTTDDVIDIIFDKAPTSDEMIVFNNIISTHIPASTVSYIGNVSLQPKVEKTNTTTYRQMLSFNYLGSSNVLPILAIQYISYMTGTITSYNIRIVDVTNNLIMAEQNCNNKTDQIQYLTNLDNVPINNSIIEVQMKRIGGTSNDFIYFTNFAYYY